MTLSKVFDCNFGLEPTILVPTGDFFNMTNKNPLSRVLALLLLFGLFTSLSTAQSTNSEQTSNTSEKNTRPDWHNTEIINAKNNEAFTLASLEGKTIFIEPMATWCSYCSYQLDIVNQAKQQLIDENLNEDFVFLALSVEGNIANEKLVKHAERLEVDLIFAAASPDLLRGITNEFGRDAIHPHSTPHFIVKNNGDMTELKTGLETVEDIYDELIAVHSPTIMEESN